MIKLGLADELRLGDLSARRDWGFAGDYVKAMWLSLQHVTPGDYIVATGETHSVHEFCEIAFAHLGLRFENYVVEDRENFAARSRDAGWEPGESQTPPRLDPTVDFEQLVKMMVDADLRSLAISRPEPDPALKTLTVVQDSAPTKRILTDEDQD